MVIELIENALLNNWVSETQKLHIYIEGLITGSETSQTVKHNRQLASSAGISPR
jgi:hypothetical protein